ncbi:WapI family immunity protein [Domibacillus indicus]|uniref:WapI family immunity protein n=1 Tax=Domibacillus indicus TaxID=1437523 RepID=UPI000617D557|nr:hypothetical protein [Domibacillus indicus]
MRFLIAGQETKIEMNVIERMYSNTVDYWDSNWMRSQLRIEIPGYLVHFEAALRTDELSDFLQQLKKMNEKLKGAASFSAMDGWMDIECSMNALGGLNWQVETCYPAGYGAVLQFEFESDQSYLNSLIKELEAVLAVFPVTGKP